MKNDRFKCLQSCVVPTYRFNIVFGVLTAPETAGISASFFAGTFGH
jgi:hypothetical protein